MHLSRTSFPRRRATGFTLIEVLVTLVVVAVGMLGLAKLQAAAVSEAGTSRTRALMTLQAESLASLMRGNRTFWAATTGPFPAFALAADGTTTYTNIAVGTPDAACKTSTCTVAGLAHADLDAWTTAFVAAKFPSATASITCVTPSGSACTASTTVPTSYDIKLAWTERFVAINASTLPSGTAPSVSMILHVQP